MTNLTFWLPSFDVDLYRDASGQNTASSAISMAATNWGLSGGSTLAFPSPLSDLYISTSNPWALKADGLDFVEMKPSVSFRYSTSVTNVVDAQGEAKLSSVNADAIGAANLTRIAMSPQRGAAETPLIEVIAEWDGYVEEIHADYFVARMRGLQGNGVEGKDEEAEIPISDVDVGDRDLLAFGGFFRLTIFYESRKVGPKRRYTTVQFRRLPAYSERDIQAAHRLASELSDVQLEQSGEAASG